MTKTVTILDCDFGQGEVEREVLEPLGFEVKLGSAVSRHDVIALAAGSVGLLTQYAPVGRAVFEAHPEIRAVVRYGVGVECIDATAAKEFGIGVSGVSDYCNDEVADHALALLLTALRSTHVSDREIKAGRWPIPDELPMMGTLRGLTFGLLGFGRIAREVATRAKAFGCRVIAYDPYVEEVTMKHLGVECVSLEDALSASIVSLHLPATDETNRMIDAKAMSHMQQGAIMLNVSRGAIIDEAALLDALDVGHIAYACLDVFEHEGPGLKLAQHPRVIASAHSGYYSPRALEELRRRAALNLANLLRESKP